MELISQLLAYAKEHNKLWIVPLILFLLALGSIMILAEGSVVAPFIYAIF